MLSSISPRKTILLKFNILIILGLVLFGCSEDSGSTEVQDVNLIELTAENDLTELLKAAKENNKTSILYFHADWCGPCNKYRESLSDNLLKEALKDAQLIGVDIDQDPHELADLHNVSSIPAFVKLDENASVLAQITGGEWDADIPENIAPVMDKLANSTHYDK